MLKVQTLLVLGLVCISSASGAERWQDRASNGRMKYRLDLDALQRNGDLLTYRVEITFPGVPERAGQRVISTSVVDCRAAKRKHIASETHFPDGTMRKDGGSSYWLDLKEWEFGTGVRNEYCGEVK